MTAAPSAGVKHARALKASKPTAARVRMAVLQQGKARRVCLRTQKGGRGLSLSHNSGCSAQACTRHGHHSQLWALTHSRASQHLMVPAAPGGLGAWCARAEATHQHAAQPREDASQHSRLEILLTDDQWLRPSCVVPTRAAPDSQHHFHKRSTRLGTGHCRTAAVHAVRHNTNSFGSSVVTGDPRDTKQAQCHRPRACYNKLVVLLHTGWVRAWQRSSADCKAVPCSRRRPTGNLAYKVARGLALLVPAHTQQGNCSKKHHLSAGGNVSGAAQNTPQTTGSRTLSLSQRPPHTHGIQTNARQHGPSSIFAAAQGQTHSTHPTVSLLPLPLLVRVLMQQHHMCCTMQGGHSAHVGACSLSNTRAWPSPDV
jgi:hypothetical protein